MFFTKYCNWNSFVTYVLLIDPEYSDKMGGRKPAVAPSKVIDAIVHFKNKVICTDVCNGEISEYIIYNLIYNIL